MKPRHLPFALWKAFHSIFHVLTVVQIQAIFEINVGKRRIRDRTTLDLNDLVFKWFWIDLEIQFHSRSMSDPALSDIDFKNKMALVWTTLNGYVEHNLSLNTSINIRIFWHDIFVTAVSQMSNKCHINATSRKIQYATQNCHLYVHVRIPVPYLTNALSMVVPYLSL